MCDPTTVYVTAPYSKMFIAFLFCGLIRCVPSKSTATVKLELLPLTDGIITLDTLQIAVKEKGKLLPTSSISLFPFLILLLSYDKFEG